MGQITNATLRPVAELTPYERNAKQHSDEQVRKIADSIQAFGFLSPVLIDTDGNIVAGHGRVMAAKLLGMTEVPCVSIEGLSDEQRRAYIIADNRLTELGGWDTQLVKDELASISFSGFDPNLTGFTFQAEANEAYDAFTDKFTPKLTTDDCYTPPAVYEAVRSWCVKEYELAGHEIVRPFYPGGDYQRFAYPAGCAVIDNPPFSILSEIVRWYQKMKIPFFLFAPSLTLFSIASGECNYLPVAADVTFENGAKVGISFVTSMGAYKIDTAPELLEAVAKADRASHDLPAELPSYKYPDTVLLSNTLARASKYAGRIQIKDARFIRRLESQKADDKALYGGGFLISQKAAEKAAAEKAAAEKAARYWPLSEKELEIIRELEDEV